MAVTLDAAAAAAAVRLCHGQSTAHDLLYWLVQASLVLLLVRLTDPMD